MSHVFVGIDPGLSGAVAMIGNLGIAGQTDETVTVFDAPVMMSGKRLVYDIGTMKAVLSQASAHTGFTAMCAMEKVHAMPKNGSIGNFRLGYGFGLWEAILVVVKMRYQLIAPQTWKKAMMPDMPKEKDSSRVRAIQMFPQYADKMNLKKHHGRADALLIAEYLRRQYYAPIKQIPNETRS